MMSFNDDKGGTEDLMTSETRIHIERYLKVDSQSLSSDAPGWGDALGKTNGPICWKCKGVGHIKRPKRTTQNFMLPEPKEKPDDVSSQYHVHIDTSMEVTSVNKCPVCHGLKHLPPKFKDTYSRHSHTLGMITSKRRAPPEWKDFGPTAFAFQQMQKFMLRPSLKSIDTQDHNHPLYLLHLAGDTSSRSEGITIPSLSQDFKRIFPWLPIHSGEQLCNLVGNWRILQRVGSHRWTTDDLVTAFVAREEFQKIRNLQKMQQSILKEDQPINYLDLGCGNASVLQMTTWGLLQSFDVMAYGIEARLEAVELARRSLSFNLGPDCDFSHYQSIDRIHSCQAAIIHHDFRTLLHEPSMIQNEDLKRIQQMKFHLITGTPPYFRVDFASYNNPKEVTTVQAVSPKAIINQGGMPTSIQSAPARCEFRGGIEAYCDVAATLLSEDGIFVVCENWLNIRRVYSCVISIGLEIQSVLPVKGKEGRKENLFGVFVMRKLSSRIIDGNGESYSNVSTKELDPISVRSKDGAWTQSYIRILDSMSIAHNT